MRTDTEMAQRREYIVYGLVCPIKKQIVYIGNTGKPRARMSGHLTFTAKEKDSNTPYNAWRRELVSTNRLKDVKMVRLSGYISKSDAAFEEYRLIEKLSKTHELVNFNKVTKSNDYQFEMTLDEYEKLSGQKLDLQTEKASA